MLFYAKGLTQESSRVIGTESVLQHCIDVGLVMKEFLVNHYYTSVTKLIAKNMGISEKGVIDFFSFFAALHDIGKVHPIFQCNFDNAREEFVNGGIFQEGFLTRLYYESNVKKSETGDILHVSVGKNLRVRHEVVTRKILMCNFKELKRNKLFDGMCYALSSHHEKDSISCELEYNFVNNEYFKKEQDLTLKELNNIFPFNFDLFKSDFKNVNLICEIFLGLLVLSDWIASSDYFLKDIEFFNGLTEYSEYIEKRSKYVQYILYEKLKFKQENEGIKNNFSFENLFGVKNYTLRPIQEKMVTVLKEQTPSVVLVEAPMGEGKTETALYAAGVLCERFHKQGIYFALPTSATSTMMYERVKKIFEKQGISDLNILHSTSFLMEKMFKNDLDYDVNFFNSTRTGLFIANGVGTIDQAMMSVLKNKFSVLRLIGLVNKVLVIDEIHAYDAYMQGILIKLLNWCKFLEIPVIMLSATLPKKLKKKLLSVFTTNLDLKSDSYPLITTISDNDLMSEYEGMKTYMKKDIQFSFVYQDLGVVKIAKSQGSKNLGIVCNTIKESIRLFETLKSQGLKNVILLHSNFKYKDRLEKENFVKEHLGKENRTNGLIVIGTQVLEQSLDIDFDTLITYLAPIDLVLQRIGRWRRFDIKGRKSDKTVFVVMPEIRGIYRDTAFEYPYNKYIMSATENFLYENKKIKLPIDFRKCVEGVYSDEIINKSQEGIEYLLEEQTKLQASQVGTIFGVDESEKCYRKINTSSKVLSNIDDFEFYSTRLAVLKRKVVLLSKDEFISLCNEDDKSILQEVEPKSEDRIKCKKCFEVKNIKTAKLLLSNVVSVYDNAFSSDLKSAVCIKLKGYLSGYYAYIYENLPITIDNKQNLWYDVEKGLRVVKE